jgi:hypothetical protein
MAYGLIHVKVSHIVWRIMGHTLIGSNTHPFDEQAGNSCLHTTGKAECQPSSLQIILNASDL